MALIPEFKPHAFSTTWLSFFGQWLTLLITAVLTVPTAVVLSLLLSGRVLLGLTSLMLWLLALWFILVGLHKHGVIRLMLSLPVLVIASVVIAFSWANL
jgi:hypothetical protein